MFAVCDSPQRDPREHSGNRAGGCKLDCKRSRVSKSSPGSAGGSPPSHLLCPAGWHCPGHGSHAHCTEIPQLFCPEPPKQCCCGSTFHRGTFSSVFSAVLVWGVYLTQVSGHGDQICCEGPFLPPAGDAHGWENPAEHLFKVVKVQLFMLQKQNISVNTSRHTGVWLELCNLPLDNLECEFVCKSFHKVQGVISSMSGWAQVNFYKILFHQPFTVCVQHTKLPGCWIKAVNLSCQSQKMLDQAAGTFMTFPYYKHWDAIVHGGH